MTSRRLKVAVVGGGTLGLYVAARPNGRADVTVIDAATPALTMHDELLGAQRALGGHVGSDTGCASGMGGTSKLWGGQLLPWESWEFDGGLARPSWPIEFADIAPHYGKVMSNLGLSSTHEGVHEHGARGATIPSTDDFTARYSAWMRRNERDFRRNQWITKATRGLRVLSPGVVRSVRQVEGYFELDVQSKAGPPEKVRADRIILAAGTLGNTRILARSLPREHVELVGAGFMDQVSQRIIRFEVADWQRFRSFVAQRIVRGVRTSLKLVTTPDFSKRHGVLPGYAHWEFDVQDSAVGRLLRRKRPNAADLLRESLAVRDRGRSGACGVAMTRGTRSIGFKILPVHVLRDEGRARP